MEMLASGPSTFFHLQKPLSNYSYLPFRLKQRDIHEKRAEQKRTMVAMEQEHINNGVLYPKVVDFTNQVEQGGPGAFNTIVERLRVEPSPDAPAPDAPMRYDDMLLDLMNSILEECKKENVDMNDKTNLGEILVQKLKGHQLQIQARQKLLENEMEQQKTERSKKITSEDIHDGFSSAVGLPIGQNMFLADVILRSGSMQKDLTNLSLLNHHCRNRRTRGRRKRPQLKP
jgi:hypothetical protein